MTMPVQMIYHNACHLTPDITLKLFILTQSDLQNSMRLQWLPKVAQSMFHNKSHKAKIDFFCFQLK